MAEHHVEAIESAVARLNAADVDGYLAHFEPECLHWISGITEPMPMPDFIQSQVYELGDDGRIRTSWAFGDVGELFRQIDGTKGSPS